jgi:hypothetical protein
MRLSLGSTIIFKYLLKTLKTGRIGVVIGGLLFFSSCSSLFYYPSRQLYYPPNQLGFEFREIAFQSLDGTQLYGWYFPAPQGATLQGTVIQFHGNAQNMSSHYLTLAWLAEQGYELFVFDYRGYGKSQGNPSQKGTYEDALAALDQAWKLHHEKGKKKLIVVGQSLGGAIAMRALADFPHRSDVSLIVLDSTFMSYTSIAHKKLSSFWLTWPLSPLAGILISNEYSAEKALKANSIPVLVIADRRDPVVPFSCSEEFYPEITAKKDFWILDEGHHVGSLVRHESEYRARFLKLLDQL